MRNKVIGPIIFVVFCLVTCSGMLASTARVAETAQQFAPIPRATADIAIDRRQQEAQITAEYIAVLATEVYSDTQVSHALIRQGEQEQHERDRALAETVNTVKQVCAWAVGALVTVGSLCLSAMAGWATLGVIVALAYYAYERYRMAREFVPYQVLPYQPVLLPGWKMLIDPSTGRQTNVSTEYPVEMGHGQLLIERRIASHKPGMVETMGDTITRAMGAIGRYRVRIRNGERHPETGREIIER